MPTEEIIASVEEEDGKSKDDVNSSVGQEGAIQEDIPKFASTKMIVSVRKDDDEIESKVVTNTSVVQEDYKSNAGPIEASAVLQPKRKRDDCETNIEMSDSSNKRTKLVRNEDEYQGIKGVEDDEEIHMDLSDMLTCLQSAGFGTMDKYLNDKCLSVNHRDELLQGRYTSSCFRKNILTGELLIPPKDKKWNFDHLPEVIKSAAVSEASFLSRPVFGGGILLHESRPSPVRCSHFCRIDTILSALCRTTCGRQSQGRT
jgi:hypothetical protein